MRELWVVCVFYMQKMKVNNDMGSGLTLLFVDT